MSDRTRFGRDTALRIACAIFVCASLAAPARAENVYLVAKEFDQALPSTDPAAAPGTLVQVRMWGYALDPDLNLDGVGDCYASGANPVNPGCVTAAPGAPGPRLTVPAADPVLRIHLSNLLPVPTSIVVPGLGLPTVSAPTPVWTDGSAGPRIDAAQRVRSFTAEAPPGGTRRYSWNPADGNPFAPGTRLYQSGTHTGLQQHMGLYGAATRDTARLGGETGRIAYRAEDGSPVAYEQEVLLLYSEIDQNLHDLAATGDLDGAVAKPLHYEPDWFLVNGKPFVATDLLSQRYTGLRPGRTTLLRLLNAGLIFRVPTVQGPYLRVVAEDARLYPFAREQYDAHLQAGKTKDALVEFASPGRYAVHDQHLGLTTGPSTPGGMLSYLVLAAGAGTCGDGVTDPGEQCDDGAANSDTGPSACRTDCTAPRCGDGVQDVGETCDDGNTISGDGCPASCATGVIGPNLLTNGDFSAGSAGWSLFTNGQASLSTAGGEACVNVTVSGTNVQLLQAPVPLSGNTDYLLTFRARHSAAGLISIHTIKNTAPFNHYGLDVDVTLTPTMQMYSFPFHTFSGDKSDARFRFQLDASDFAGSTICFDDVAIQEAAITGGGCGDGTVDPGEVCDGLDLGGGTCSAQGFEGGDPSCLPDCSGFDTSACFLCGNNVLEPGEVCDGTDLGGETCVSQATGGGDLGCNADCSDFDASGCFDCGNGILEGVEQCDDGVNNSDVLPDACRTTCMFAGCGDAVVDTGEGCDDGNAAVGDGCDLACTVEAGFDCSGSPSVCVSSCGNGTLDAGEECDNGPANSDVLADACRSDCTLPVCGDGVTDSGEPCDAGAGNSDTVPNACRTGCTLPVCGDGVTDAGEQCDDGNLIEDDLCTSGCVLNAVNLLQNGDFSNGQTGWSFTTNGSASFQVVNGEARVDVTTGGSVMQLFQAPLAVQGGQTYIVRLRARQTSANSFSLRMFQTTSPYTDLGLRILDIPLTSTMETHAFEFTATSTNSAARFVLQLDRGDDNGSTFFFDDVQLFEGSLLGTCGNGVVEGFEECDSGAANSDVLADACRTDCTLASCGDGVTDTGEECDNGAANSDTVADACRTTCVLPICGDGVIDTGEGCDDGNTVDGDLCSNACVASAVNLLQNGDFSSGKTGWSFTTNGTSSFSVVNGEAQVAITTSGSVVQLFQAVLSVQAGQTYVLQFRARHTAANSVSLRMFQHTAPYTDLGLRILDTPLTATMQTYQFQFTATSANNQARFVFQLDRGDDPGSTFFFDDVMLYEAP